MATNRNDLSKVEPDAEPVHWHEGLFLQPHHFQALQRFVVNRIGAERDLAWAYSYGLMSMTYRVAELQKMRVCVENLSAVMPNGTLVNVPGNADVHPLSIKRRFKDNTRPFIVYFAIPRWQPHHANAVADSNDAADVKRPYTIAERPQCDENTGQNEQTIVRRRFNARLLLEGDDLDGYDCIPIMRIEHAAGDDLGQPVEDSRFAPPCLILRGSDVIYRMVREVITSIDATRKQLATGLVRAGYEPATLAGVQIEQMLRLSALFRGSARLQEIIRCETIQPIEAFCELRALLGDLAALRPNDPDLFDTPPYDHEEPYEPFVKLVTRINSLLQISDVAQYKAIEFTREDRCLSAEITDEQFDQAQSWFLAVTSTQAPGTIVQTVENGNKFKFMSRSQISKAIFGIDLQQEHVPPVALPAKAGLLYFRLNLEKSGERWREIRKEKRVAVRWAEMSRSDFELKLCYILKAGDE